MLFIWSSYLCGLPAALLVSSSLQEVQWLTGRFQMAMSCMRLSRLTCLRDNCFLVVFGIGFVRHVAMHNTTCESQIAPVHHVRIVKAARCFASSL